MADAKVHVSRAFFKDITIESHRLRWYAHAQLIFIDQARVRAARIGDSEQLFILDEVESFLVNIRDCADRLEKNVSRETIWFL